MKKLFDQPLSEALISALRDSGQSLVRYDLNDHPRERVKSAASRLFSKDRILELKPPDTHFGVHHVIMGSEEAYGPNRNWDAFPAATLDSSHHTFVKCGHVYREHRHKPTDLKLGMIKASAYCPKLQRVELYIWVCKSAAAKEYEEAKQGKQHSFSMSAAMPWDECSICDNHASKPENYCSDLAFNLGGWDRAMQKYAYARNPIARFFDDSFVVVPAERTAYAIESSLDRIKSASGRVLSAADIAAMLHAEIPDYRDEVYVKMASLLSVPEVKDILVKMAAAEQRIEEAWHGGAKDVLIEHGIACASSDYEVPEESLRKIAALQPGTVMYHLAKRAMFLPFKSFMGWATGRSYADLDVDPVIKEASACLPTMLRDIASAIEDSTLETEVIQDMPKILTASGPMEADIDCACTDEVQKLMDHAGEQLSCRFGDLQRRAKTTIIKSAGVKSMGHQKPANVSAEALFYVHNYGLYKVAAVRDIIKHGPKMGNVDLLAVASHYPFFTR